MEKLNRRRWSRHPRCSRPYSQTPFRAIMRKKLIRQLRNTRNLRVTSPLTQIIVLGLIQLSRYWTNTLSYLIDQGRGWWPVKSGADCLFTSLIDPLNKLLHPRGPFLKINPLKTVFFPIQRIKPERWDCHRSCPANGWLPFDSPFLTLSSSSSSTSSICTEAQKKYFTVLY